MEDIGHLHGGPAHDCGRLPLQTGPRHHRGRRHVQLLERIGRRVEVASREVEIHRRVRQVGVTEQELNRAQVGARFQQMRRVGVPQRVRRDAFVDAGLPRGEAHGLPDHLRGDRAHRHASRGASRERDRSAAASTGSTARSAARSVGTEGNLAIAAALALLDAEHHALAIDVADFELARFAAAQAGAVERQQQRAVIEILRARDQALDLVGTEHDRQAEPLLRIRQVLAHVAPLQDIPAEEPQRADLRDHGPDGEPPLLEEKQVVASELGRA